MDDQDDVNPGRDVMEDLVRAFRSWVDGREWLHMRLTVRPSLLSFSAVGPTADNDSCNSSHTLSLLASLPQRPCSSCTSRSLLCCRSSEGAVTARRG